MRSALLGLVGLAYATAASAQPPSSPSAPDSCHAGVYRLADGAVVDMAPTVDGKGLRWRLMDGRTGRIDPTPSGPWKASFGLTQRPDTTQVSFGGCEEGVVSFDGKAGRRVELDVRDTVFAGAGGVRLAGRLVLPKGSGAVPVSVNVHGSENTSARRFSFEQRMWPAQGVGWFVYDKRGTGESEGKYTQDFNVLAEDAAAAAREARRLAGRRVARLGFDGGSQAGWIIPLAAAKVPVDYAIVRYGMAEGPLAEDRAETLQGLEEKGWGPDVLAKATEVTTATGKIVASHFKEGWDELRMVRAKYEKEPWYKDLKGEFTGDVAKNSEMAVKLIGPQRETGTPWDYEPMPVLRQVNAPILWLLAGADREAPIAETKRRLVQLAGEGRPITVLEFPATDHGIMEFEQRPDGQRVFTRWAEGYYPAVLEFTKTGQLKGTYGKAARLTR
jgi:dienelactone hydrolase